MHVVLQFEQEESQLVNSDLQCHCREKLWKRYVDELILERDDPSKLAGRSRVASKGKASDKDKHSYRDGNQERDQAYDREYLAHDRKRLKRD